MTQGISSDRLAAAVAMNGAVGFIGSGDEGMVESELGLDPNENQTKKFLHHIPFGTILKRYNSATEICKAQTFEHEWGGVKKWGKHETSHHNLGIGLNIEQAVKDPSLFSQVLLLKPRYIWLGFSPGYEKYISKAFFDLFLQEGQGIHKQPRQNLKLFVQTHSVHDAMMAAHAGAHCVVLQRSIFGKKYGQCSVAQSEEQAQTATKMLTPLKEYGEQLLELRRQLEDYYFPNLGAMPFIFAAGGLHTGREMAYCLAHGADGITVGTRFAVSDEASLSQERKCAILSHHCSDFDHPFLEDADPDKSASLDYEVYYHSSDQSRYDIHPGMDCFSSDSTESDLQTSLRKSHRPEDSMQILHRELDEVYTLNANNISADDIEGLKLHSHNSDELHEAASPSEQQEGLPFIMPASIEPAADIAQKMLDEIVFQYPSPWRPSE